MNTMIFHPTGCHQVTHIITTGCTPAGQSSSAGQCSQAGHQMPKDTPALDLPNIQSSEQHASQQEIGSASEQSSWLSGAMNYLGTLLGGLLLDRVGKGPGGTTGTGGSSWGSLWGIGKKVLSVVGGLASRVIKPGGFLGSIASKIRGLF